MTHSKRLKRNANRTRRGRNHKRLRLERLEARRVLTGPYAPAAGQEGSTAIELDDDRIESWAVAWENYIPGAEVDAAWQTPGAVLGPGSGDPLDIVSLGRGGQITVTFAAPIRDGDGPDFVIFENAITDNFLELGYVEVSSDGENFFRFPNDSLTAGPVGAFGAVDPTEISGFAGKYRVGFGAPFDLADFASVSPLLDRDQVTHVRVIDIPGDGTRLDSGGDAIYDPFPTVGSAGVDLQAVGVINAAQFLTSTTDFEALGSELPANGHWNGPDPNGTSRDGLDGSPVTVGAFEAGGALFNNIFSPQFGSWNGWSYSKNTDTTTPGFTNQFSAFPGTGADGSPTYAVAFRDVREGEVWVDRYPLPTISLGPEQGGSFFQSVSITNTTFAALSMQSGDSFAKKFGGATGNDPDWFLLTIEGLDESGASVGTIESYLADFRFADNAQDFIVDDWVDVDLTSLRGATSLEFKVTSSDVGTFGLNTPAYFALDNLVVAQEILPLTVAVSSASESSGDPVIATVGRGSSDPSLPLTVQLMSSDESEATVPESVVIPANQTAINFQISTVDDDVVDGSQNVTITASAVGFADGTTLLTVTDDDVPTLSVSVNPGPLSEADAAPTARFEDVGLGLTEESFWNGSDGSGGFVTDGVHFNNDYNSAFSFWTGWAASNGTDTTTPGFLSQYSAFTGEGAADSSTYGVSFTGGVTPTISLTDDTSSLGFESLMVTNTTYAALSMLNGDAFAKKFGGADGTDPDFFRLTIEGLNATGVSVGTVEFYLADYRSADSAEDYVLDEWREVDLSSLAGATSLTFALDSSDVGAFGMNTPAYFAVDNIVLGSGAPVTGTVRRNSEDLSGPLSVSLEVDDHSEVDVPRTVEIPAGQVSVDFPVSILNDVLVDGTQVALISAAADGHIDGQAEVEVADDDLRSLTIALSNSHVSEGAAPASVRFEDVGFTLEDESFWNGSNGAGEIVSDGVHFNNDFNPSFGSWSGFAVSNSTDVTTPGFGNQYSAYTGAGALGSSTYAVSFTAGISPTASLTAENADLGFKSMMVTNTTYAALSMLNGDAFAKKFGGTDGTDPDFFRLTISGNASDGSSVGEVEVYLADYRSADPADDFILDEWQEVDLTSLAGASSLSFALDSSDVGVFGMNTPAFFALDNIILNDPVATTAVVGRNDADISAPLTVTLASDDLSEFGLPSSVEIPANQRAVQFSTYVVDDLQFDGPREVTIHANAESYNEGLADVIVDDNDELLSVGDLIPNATGFVAEFDLPLDDGPLNLYVPELLGDADVRVVGATTGPVAGSLLADESLSKVTFVSSSGPLPADTYTVTLRSALGGFQTPAGIPLDGDGNQVPGGQFESTFTVDARPQGTVVVSIPDVIRGPGQAVNVPAIGTGLPIVLSEAAEVSGASLQVNYDPDLLEITGIAVAAGIPEGAAATLDTSTPGLALVTFTSPAALPAGEVAIVELQAAVPAEASYGATSLLDLHSIVLTTITAAPISAVDSDGLQIVSLFGDVTGNGRVNAADAAAIARHVAGLQTGFDATKLVDPLLVSDISGNRRVNAVDASKVAQFVALIEVPEIPPLPAGAQIAVAAELLGEPAISKEQHRVDRALEEFGLAIGVGEEVSWPSMDPGDSFAVELDGSASDLLALEALGEAEWEELAGFDRLD